MTQQEIFSLLLIVLLLSSKQLDNSEEIDFSDLNNVILITLLFRFFNTSNGSSNGNCSCQNTNSSF